MNNNSSETKLSTHRPTKLTDDRRNAQKRRHQANVAILTPLLIDGVYADERPRKLWSYWTKVHQIFTGCSQIIFAVNASIRIVIGLFQSVLECQGDE